ncbi:MAG: hypothetical protein QOC79_1119, partial [Actinomycetota bacterium]|nr:hypothetical protein [Actinomycetota bacterium]
DAEAAAARIQPELRRNTWPRDNADALEVPGEIERLAKFLADLAGAHSVFEPGHPPPSPWEEALLVERRTGLARLRTATSEADAAIRRRDEEAKVVVEQRDENAREKDALGQQLHARNLEFDALGESARAEKEQVVAERDRLGRELEAVRARLAEVEADLDDVQTRRRDAEKALRVTTRRLEARERSLPIRVARAFKRVRRR